MCFSRSRSPCLKNLTQYHLLHARTWRIRLFVYQLFAFLRYPPRVKGRRPARSYLAFTIVGRSILSATVALSRLASKDILSILSQTSK
jgi:hypothetical protein